MLHLRFTEKIVKNEEQSKKKVFISASLILNCIFWQQSGEKYLQNHH